METFNAGQFRAAHNVEIVKAFDDHGQTTLGPRNLRAVVKHLDGSIVHDSQQAYGDAGLYSTGPDALEHGMAWIDMEAARRRRVLEVAASRRDREAPLLGRSQQRIADYTRQRKDLTAKINDEKAYQKRINDETLNPDVKLEFGGSGRFEIVVAPSTFEGQLDAHGREVKRPPNYRAASETMAAQDHAEQRLEAQAEATEVAQATVEQARAKTADELLADLPATGSMAPGDLVKVLGEHHFAQATLAAVAGCEAKRGRPRRSVLAALVRAGMPDPAKDPEAWAKRAAEGLDLQAAMLITKPSPSKAELQGLIAECDDPVVLDYVLAREQRRSGARKKPRGAVINAAQTRRRHLDARPASATSMAAALEQVGVAPPAAERDAEPDNAGDVRPRDRHEPAHGPTEVDPGPGCVAEIRFAGSDQAEVLELALGWCSLRGVRLDGDPKPDQQGNLAALLIGAEEPVDGEVEPNELELGSMRIAMIEDGAGGWRFAGEVSLELERLIDVDCRACSNATPLVDVADHVKGWAEDALICSTCMNTGGSNARSKGEG